jgi:hypothetical protein
MYTIANKHNKKTRKLSSSSRNKHKSKSKNKRKHKYTIGKTRKYTKSHNTIHIGGLAREYLKKREGKQAYTGKSQSVQALPDTVQALPAQQIASQRVKLARQSLSQNQPDVTISDSSRQGQTPISTRRSAAPSRRSSTEMVTEYGILPVSPKFTEETPLRPPQDNVDEEENQRAESEAAKKTEAQRLKAAAEAKKVQREERLNKKKEDMKAASLEMYNKFISTINDYDFDTSTEEPYIRFSKFIQEIMDLQFSIKDDEFRKKAQTITDQILTAYSALISYNCSTKFLKKHFQDYMGKLKSQNKLQQTIKIVDPTEPTPKIDEQVSSITEKLTRLAQAQVCDHPLSEHLVKEPVTDSDSPFFRFPSLPSFTIPSFTSFTNPFKRTTQLPEITPTTSTPKASAASADSPDTNDQNDKATTNPSSPPPGSVIQLKTFGDNLDQESEEGRGRTRTSFDKLSSSLRGTTRTSAAASTRTNPNASTTRSREASTVSTPPAPASIAAQPSPTEHIYYRSPNNTILTFDIYKNDPEHPNKIVIKYRGYIGTSGNTGNFISDNIYRKKIPEADVYYNGYQGAYTLALILNQDQFSSLKTAAQNNRQWTLIPAVAGTPHITFPGTWHSDEASANSYIAVPAAVSTRTTSNASRRAPASGSINYDVFNDSEDNFEDRLG